MKRWNVSIYESVVHTTEVEAETKNEAYELAYDKIMNGPEDEYTTESIGLTGMWDAWEF